MNLSSIPGLYWDYITLCTGPGEIPMLVCFMGSSQGDYIIYGEPSGYSCHSVIV